MLGVSEDTHLSLAGEPLGTAAGCGASAVNCPAGTHSQPAPGSGWRRAPWTPKSGRPCFCAFWPETVHGFHPALRGPVTPSEAPTQGPCPQGASAGGGRRGGHSRCKCHLLMFLNFALLYFLPPDNKSPACACPVLAYRGDGRSLVSSRGRPGGLPVPGPGYTVPCPPPPRPSSPPPRLTVGLHRAASSAGHRDCRDQTLSKQAWPSAPGCDGAWGGLARLSHRHPRWLCRLARVALHACQSRSRGRGLLRRRGRLRPRAWSPAGAALIRTYTGPGFSSLATTSSSGSSSVAPRRRGMCQLAGRTAGSSQKMKPGWWTAAPSAPARWGSGRRLPPGPGRRIHGARGSHECLSFLVEVQNHVPPDLLPARDLRQPGPGRGRVLPLLLPP